MALYLKNRTASDVIEGCTTYEKWYNKEPVGSHLRIFDSEAFVHISKEQRTKFEKNSVKYILVGYNDSSKACRVYDSKTKKVFIRRYVIFNENYGMTNVILLASITLLGILITLSLFLAGGYFWWHHKRSQLKFVEPNENTNSSTYSLSKKVDQQETQDCGTVVAKAQPQIQPQQTPMPLQNSLNFKLNGFLNFKSPLVSSIQPIKPPGAVTDTSGDSENKLMQINDMYMDNAESNENVGQIHFSVEYDFQNTTFILKVLQGKELPAKDLSGTSDPYVRVTLLPDKKHRLDTKIKRRTLNPRWNETFYFEGYPIQKLQCRVLHLHVFDYDRFSRDDSIGEVFLPLFQVDFKTKQTFWKTLKPPAKDKCGELLSSLCYHPSNSILTLTLIKARNLKAKDINGKSDPYVKVWLQFGDKRVEKRKTPVFTCTLDPVFNESFQFNVPWEKIRECSLDVMVMDFDNIGRNELIGRILLAGKNGSGASESKHWQDMISKPRQTVVQWHRLKAE